MLVTTGCVSILEVSECGAMWVQEGSEAESEPVKGMVPLNSALLLPQGLLLRNIVGCLSSAEHEQRDTQALSGAAGGV